MTDLRSQDVRPSLEDFISSLPLRPEALDAPLDLSLSSKVDLDSFIDRATNANITLADVFEIDGKRLLYRYATIDNFEECLMHVCNLLDLALLVYELGHIELTIMHEYLEDLLEIETIDWCQTFWRYIETRESRLTKNLSGTRRPGSNLIRYCNALLRRLSKTQNLAFAGKILFFLAKAFSLSERSGVNLRGAFNTENVTQWDTTDESSIYSKFWSLQRIFANPVDLLNFPNKQLLFQEILKVVLEKLREYSSTGALTDRAVPGKRTTTQEDIDMLSEPIENDSFIPKWLTSPSLFELELHDAKFRRTIYAQIYILCDFLIAHQRDSALHNIANRSVQYERTVGPELAKFCKSVQDSFGRSLPGPNAIDLEPTFVRSLKLVVSRDANWTNWKRDNAPLFEMPPFPASEIEEAKKVLQARRGLKRPYRFLMGTAALSRLDNVPTGIGRLKTEERYRVPNAQSYSDSIERAKLTISETNDPDLKRELTEAISSREWRGLRAARAHGLWLDFDKYDNKEGVKSLFGPPKEKPSRISRAKSQSVTEGSEPAAETPAEVSVVSTPENTTEARAKGTATDNASVLDTTMSDMPSAESRKTDDPMCDIPNADVQMLDESQREITPTENIKKTN
ncbi:THO complex subunit 1 transcription elongation factor-domain-containing protein [Lipomyces arxii]|uniref:THO complex subunit 1 transcription elongation factor-domain-containing protein n=1 Tax=Lipomyces arxii TaxID=56418 RepID=UPI0034CF8038